MCGATWHQCYLILHARPHRKSSTNSSSAVPGETLPVLADCGCADFRVLFFTEAPYIKVSCSHVLPRARTRLNNGNINAIVQKFQDNAKQI